MNGHVLDLLGAYLDGELSSAKIQKIETHLMECSLCSSEFEGLRRVSRLIQDSPVPEFSSVDHFAARVVLQLPRKQETSRSVSRSTIVWWAIPIFLITAWFFIQTVSTISGMLFVVNQSEAFGDSVIAGESGRGLPSWYSLLTGLITALVDIPQNGSISLMQDIASVSREVLGQFLWQAAIALPYLGWLIFSVLKQSQQGKADNPGGF